MDLFASGLRKHPLVQDVLSQDMCTLRQSAYSSQGLENDNCAEWTISAAAIFDLLARAVYTALALLILKKVQCFNATQTGAF